MKKMLIKDGKIVNIIKAGPEFVHPDFETVDFVEGSVIGMPYANGAPDFAAWEAQLQAEEDAAAAKEMLE